MTLGGGGGEGRVCSNNPDHKVGMLAHGDTKDAEFDLSRGIRTSESEHP